MSPNTHPPHYCVLIQNEMCEERNALLHQRYLDYLVRFERWNKAKGWARYMAHRPLAALAALTRGRELPPEWCRQPMGEGDLPV
jgi:hypothetical protein